MREKLITRTTSYNRNFSGAGMSTLETKLNKLPGLNGAIPAEISSAVRVVTGHSCIPGAGQARITRIDPIHIPTIDRTGASVGNTDGAGKA